MLLAIACGPTVATSTGSADGSDDEARSAGDSGDIAAACVLGDPAACPADCYRGTALQVVDDASGPVFAEFGSQSCSGVRPTQ